jgi:hypothetical protein
MFFASSHILAPTVAKSCVLGQQRAARTAIWGCGPMRRWPHPQPPLILCRNSLAGRKPSHGCGGMTCRQERPDRISASGFVGCNGRKGCTICGCRRGCMPFLERFGQNAWEGGTERCSLSAPVPILAKELHCGNGNVGGEEHCRMLGKSSVSIGWRGISLLWRPARAIKLGSRQAGGAKPSCGFSGER